MNQDEGHNSRPQHPEAVGDTNAGAGEHDKELNQRAAAVTWGGRYIHDWQSDRRWEWSNAVEVGECGETLEDSTVLCGEGVKLRSNELICAERGP